MADAQSRVTIQFVGQDSGLNSTVATLSEQFARLESSGKGLASVFAQASETAQKLGSAGNQGATGAEKLGSATTSASRGAEQLAKSLGLNFQAAKSFSESLGLAEGKAAAALAKLQALNAVGATVQSRFEVLNKELGITGQQFVKLDGAVAAENERLAQLRVQTEQATIAQQNQAAASARQAQAAAETQQGLIGLGLASATVATAIGGAFVKGSQDFLTFNESIKSVGVNTKSLGTEDLKSLSDNVEKLGVTTSKTPLEIAKLDESLSKTSLKVNEVKEVTEGLIHTAEGLAEAPEKVGKAVSSAVNQFGLAVSDYGKVEDLFVNTLQNTNTNLGDFSQALINVGPNAKASGQSIESTAFALSLFAQQGLTGGKAGTDLGIVFNRLSIASANADPELQKLVRGSARAREAFNLLQIGVRDANGQLKPFPEILEVLRNSLGKLDNPSERSIILSAIFGTGGGAQAVNLLLNSTTDNINRAKDATTNYAGAAKAAGEQLLTGPDGAVKQFSGSIGSLNLQIGKFVGGGLEPLTRAATDLVNEFLALPIPVQNTLIGLTGFVGILAGAVAAVTAFKLAKGELVIQTGLETAAAIRDTIATNANAAAKILAAAATGTLTEAQGASISAFIESAATAGLFAGAIAAIGLAVDTFNKVNAAANETRAGLDDFEKSLTKLTEAELKSNDAATQKQAAADLETQANKRIQDSIGGVQRALDELRKIIDFFSVRHLLEEFAKLDAVPKPIKDLVNGIVNFLPKVTTVAEAAANNATAAFGEVLDSADKVQSQFQKLFKGGFENATKEEIEALNGAIAASISAIEKAQPANEADAKAKEQRINQLKEEQAELAKLGKAQADNAPGKTIGGGEAKDDPKAAKKVEKDQEQEIKAERERQAQEEADKLRDARAGAKAKEEEAFQEQERAETDAFERQQKAAKEVFAEQERLKTKQFEKELQTESEAFQKQLNLEKKAFEKELQDDEKAFRKSEDAEKKAAEKGFNAEQKGIDRELQLEFAKNPRERRDLQKRFAQEDRETARRDELEAPLKAKRDAFDEAQTQKQETFRKAQDTKKEAFDDAQSRKQDAFRNVQENKRDGFNKKIKQEEDAFDKQQSDAKQTFESKRREEEADFKQFERQKDVENAREIKRIIESIKSPIPSPIPTPDTVTPRFTGGPVVPGQTYLGGERGVERIDFGQGRDALVGSHGPQLFRVNQVGVVYPNHSALTQNLLHPQSQVVNTANYHHQSAIKSPNVNIAPVATVVYSDDALLREMRQLRSDVAAMRPIQQEFSIETKNPMSEVYAAMRQAARLNR